MKKSKALVCTACAAATLLASANIPTFRAETITLGDLTGEVKPTIGSVVRIGSYLVRREKFDNLQFSAADVERSGEVDLKDLMYVVMKLGDKIEKFPRPEPKMIDNPKVIDEYVSNEWHVKDNFADSAVIVKIKHQYSVMNQVWSPEDFDIDGIDHIEDLTYRDWSKERIQEYLNDPHVPTFRQEIAIFLKEPGKENVLKMVDEIKAKDFLEVKEVYPSYDYSLITGPIVLPPLSQQSRTKSNDKFEPCPSMGGKNFTDDRVFVTIKTQHSIMSRVWTIEDFEGIDNIDYIENIFYYPEWDARRSYEHLQNVVAYRQELCIWLKDKSRENVVKMINQIQERIDGRHFIEINQVTPNFQWEVEYELN